MATVDFTPARYKIKPASGFWPSRWTDDGDLYDTKLSLLKNVEVCYFIELPESTVSISEIVCDFRLTPVGTPTSRYLHVAFYASNPTEGLEFDPVSQATSTTLNTTVMMHRATMSGHTITGRTVYIVIYDNTEPETAYYQIDQLTTKITVTQASAPRVTAQGPKNQTLQGESQITFSWTYSGDTLDRSALSWSTDNSNWTLISDSIYGTSQPVNAFVFPRGTVYWRVRARSISGLWSDYSYASFTVQYAATSQVVPVDSPTSGRVPAEEDLTFTIALESSAPVVPPFSLASAAFFWRVGQGGDYTQTPMRITADGQTASVTVQFPNGPIEWYASGTDNTGLTTQTETYTLTAMSTAVEATALAPIDTIESGSGIVFRWGYSSLDGSPQAWAEIETSTDGDTWTHLARIEGASARSYTATAQSFPAGQIFWHVRAASAAEATSPWTEAVSFISLAAPTVTDVEADNKTFATISWQVVGQLAYEIEIDGKSIGKWFGENVLTHTLSKPLAAGAHTIRVRAQNQYGLWSDWAAGSCITETPPEIFTLDGVASASAALWWDEDAEDIPVITTQPVSMAATEGLVCFFCEAVGNIVAYQWQKKPAGASEWSIAAEGTFLKALTVAASAELDGCQYYCRVFSSTGYEDSKIVTYTYAVPENAPVITQQPKDVYQTDGVVYIWCGTAGANTFAWFHRTVTSLAMELVDSGGNAWHIPFGTAASGDVLITDGSNADWHLPAGSLQGAAAITDGNGGAWYIPTGTGEVITEWTKMDSTAPFVRFSASPQRSGEEFYCRASNEAGAVASESATFTYSEPPVTPEAEKQHYIFRDGALIGRSTSPEFEDRTANGAHVYQVINRMSNNRATISSPLELTVALDCPVIGLLAGGEWVELRYAEDPVRPVKITRKRNVAYSTYAGARYPEAEVGDQESLEISFDAFWLAQDRSKARAFEELVSETVVFKSPEDIVVVGVLDGYDKRAPKSYRSYEFRLQQSDDGGAADA